MTIQIYAATKPVGLVEQLQLPEATWAKLTVGKVYWFNGQRAKVLSKDTSPGVGKWSLSIYSVKVKWLAEKSKD